MFASIEILFIILLVAILLVIFKNEGFPGRNGFRHARADGCWEGKNRRQHPRFAESIAVAYSTLKKRIITDASGKTVDVSEGGVKLVLDEKLSIGNILNLRISFPGSDKTAELIGEVVWSEDADDVKEPSGKRLFYSGIKFVSTNQPAGQHFIDYIRSKINSARER